ncbi:FtsX-like permease family protein [Streptosporangium sp. NPDC003464]
MVASVATPFIGGRPADLAQLQALASAPGVVAHSGPFPYTQVRVNTGSVTLPTWVQGRAAATAAVDQSMVVRGSWVREGGAVLEASFAGALGVDVGDRIALDNRPYQVAGVAITAASAPYPKVCLAPCRFDSAFAALTERPPKPPPGTPDTFFVGQAGMIWLTEAETRGLARYPESLGHLINLKLTGQAEAEAFSAAHHGRRINEPALVTWQEVLEGHAKVAENVQRALLVAAWLLGLLALSSAVVLVGGRMADQMRRVGLLKAVGGTPGLVAVVLLAVNLAVALLAALAGLAAGRLTAPLLVEPGAGLLGTADTVPLTPAAVGLVIAAALAIAGLATFMPAVRAARISTVRALADSQRPPRRTSWLITLSARLPVPLLLGMRLAARRPRRTLLNVAGIAISVTGIVAALAAGANRYLEATPGDDPRLAMTRVLAPIVIMLVVQAAANAICIIWATALDTARPLALARALGATPGQVSVGLGIVVSALTCGYVDAETRESPTSVR